MLVTVDSTDLVEAPELDFSDILMTCSWVLTSSKWLTLKMTETLGLNARSTDLDEDNCINYNEKESRHHLKANSHKLHVPQPGLGEV